MDSSRYMKLSDNEENIKMGEIKYKKNKFYYMPIIQEELDDLNGEKCFSYLVLKGDKYPINKNKYKIKEGDIFKLARIYFIVRGLHIKKKKIEQKDTNCLISYHSKINQSLNINEDYNNHNYDKDDDNSSDSSNNTDICPEENENESDEEDKNDEILKITKKKDKNKNPKIKSKKKKKKKDKNLIDELKEKENNINIKPKPENNHLNTNESKKSEKQKICRICYMGEMESNTNPLIKPCRCSGSMKYIHFKCLLHWLKTKIEVDKSEFIENKFCSIYSTENVQCELCKEYLPHYIKHNNKLFNLTELEQNFESEIKVDNKNKDNKNKNTENNENSDDNYVVLDSMSPDKEILPYRYITKFSKNKTLKIGRGLEMNLILNDLSISRNHCQLELSDNGDVFLKDNNSKFGTLVLVQAKSIEILKGQTLTIQAGRTFFNIKYKSNFSLLGCCKTEEIDLKNTYERINSKSIKIDKNSVILIESDSEGEGDPDGNGKKINDEDKKEENEYENNIKKINNKKIKLMKISKKDKNTGNSDTNIKVFQQNNNNQDKDINIDKEDIKEGISMTEQKRERSKSKKKSLILNNLDFEENSKDKDNIKDKDNKKSNKKKVNYKEEQINNDKKNNGKENDK